MLFAKDEEANKMMEISLIGLPANCYLRRIWA